MKISEYIAALSQIQREHGDLEVESGPYTSRATAPSPKIAFRKILTGRARSPAFWVFGDGKGEKVVRV